MKLKSMVIAASLLAVSATVGATAPIVSFEESTTNTILSVGNSVEGMDTVYLGMDISSKTIGYDNNHVPATLIESYNTDGLGILATAYGAPNPWYPGTPPSPSHLPNACLEDIDGNRNYWVNSVYNGGTGKSRGIAVVQPYPATNTHDMFVPWEIDIEFKNLVSDFSMRMLDFGDFNPWQANDFHVRIEAYDSNGVEVEEHRLDFVSDGQVISQLLKHAGDACSSADTGEPGYMLGELKYAGIKTVKIRGAGHDPKVGFDSFNFSEFCTYTRGYWSNHPWTMDVTLGNYTFTNADSNAIFGDASNKNYGQLCAQLTAATLNCGGMNCEVSNVIANANTLLVNEDVSCNMPDVFDTPAEKAYATALKTQLDIFNNKYECED